MNVHLRLGLVSCDVLLPARRLITANDALSISQILADNFENVMVTYASILTGPQARIPSSPYQQGLGLVRGYQLALLFAPVEHFPRADFTCVQNKAGGPGVLPGKIFPF